MENHLNLIKSILVYTVERTKSFYSYVESSIVDTDINRSSLNDRGKIHMGVPRFNQCKKSYIN